jgi:hypothetical protein
VQVQAMAALSQIAVHQRPVSAHAGNVVLQRTDPSVRLETLPPRLLVPQTPAECRAPGRRQDAGAPQTALRVPSCFAAEIRARAPCAAWSPARVMTSPSLKLAEPDLRLAPGHVHAVALGIGRPSATGSRFAFGSSCGNIRTRLSGSGASTAGLHG